MKANNKPINVRRKVQKAREIGTQKRDENNEASKSQTSSESPPKEKDSVNKKMSRKASFYRELTSYRKNPLIIFLGIFLTMVVVLFLVLGLWLYQIILDQENKLDELTLKLDEMPAPVSRGRLGLIIKKSNQTLEKKINTDLSLLEDKIQEIKQELNTFPKPISEGKVGLILDKGIKKFRKDIEKQVSGVLSSIQGTDQIQAQRNDLDPKIEMKIDELELSLAALAKTIGLETLPKSITEEILELKTLVRSGQIANFSSEKTKGKLSLEISSNDFRLIERHFSDYAYKAIKQDLRSNEKEGFFNSISNKFQLIFVRRSLTPQEGNSVDAILSRAENALNLRDYEGVLEELNQLPQGASEVMMDWRKSFEIFLEERR